MLQTHTLLMFVEHLQHSKKENGYETTTIFVGHHLGKTGKITATGALKLSLPTIIKQINVKYHPLMDNYR